MPDKTERNKDISRPQNTDPSLEKEIEKLEANFKKVFEDDQPKDQEDDISCHACGKNLFWRTGTCLTCLACGEPQGGCQ